MSLSDNLRKNNYYQYPHEIRFIFNLPGEIWKPIPAYENYYEVSNYGRVKSLEREISLNLNPDLSHTKPERILAQNMQKNTITHTLQVGLCVDRIKQTLKVRDLVYTLFIEEVDFKKYEIIHSDGDGENCMVDNLEKKLRRLEDRKKEALHQKWWEQGWVNPDIPYQNMSLEVMRDEIWKPLLGYEAYYHISNLGRVKSLARPKARVMGGKNIQYEIAETIRKQVLDTRCIPYLSFTVNIDCMRREFPVAHAVFFTFIKPFDVKKHKITHLDGNTLNNHVENLSLEERKKENSIRNFTKIPKDRKVSTTEKVTIPRIEIPLMEKLKSINLTDSQKLLIENQAYSFQNLSLNDMEGEIWKGLPNYEDAIRVSNFGRIKRLKHLVENNGNPYWIEEKIAKQQLAISPESRATNLILLFRFKIKVNKQIKRVGFITARVVYSIFVTSLSFKDDKLVIRFKDDDPLNIRLDNLFPETRSEVAKIHFKKKIVTPPNFYELSPEKQYNMKNACKKKISQFDRNGKYIKTFQGISDAAREFNTEAANIGFVADKPRISKGYFWRLGDDKLPISTEILEKYKNRFSDRSKPVEQYTKENEYIATYRSIEEAALHLKCSSRLINMAVHGKIKTAKGFVFRIAYKKVE